MAKTTSAMTSDTCKTNLARAVHSTVTVTTRMSHICHAFAERHACDRVCPNLRYLRFKPTSWRAPFPAHCSETCHLKPTTSSTTDHLDDKPFSHCSSFTCIMPANRGKKPYSVSPQPVLYPCCNSPPQSDQHTLEDQTANGSTTELLAAKRIAQRPRTTSKFSTFQTRSCKSRIYITRSRRKT